jgi:phospholipid/cholesterol/gamma-HCH transport system permease protein
MQQMAADVLNTQHSSLASDAGGLDLAERVGSDLILALRGRWVLGMRLPEAGEIAGYLTPETKRLQFRSGELSAWDSLLLVFLARVKDLCQKRQIEIDPAGLPPGVRKLLDLAAAVPPTVQETLPLKPEGFISRLGNRVLARRAWLLDSIGFVGDLVLALPRLVLGRARFRREDLAFFLQDCGAGALPIVALISLLVGLILAFVGAVQLEMFGAEIFVANLVGIAMARDMGAMMTGIIMAGRTGAAFAAQLGTMEVNEEIDALRTLGISPIEFLVLPRTLALVVMMPLLCCFADLMGIIGGGLACVGLFDLSPQQYFQQTREAVPLQHFAGGLVKSAVYGAVVALAGCHRGLTCGRSAAAVGAATTAAVVTGIVWIVVWCAILTVLFNTLGI